MESKIFDLDNIRKYFSPIEELHGKLDSLHSIYDRYIELSENIENKIDKEDLVLVIKEISVNVENINHKLLDITQKNLNKFIIFQDTLIKKYKDIYANQLKRINLNNKLTKTIGLYLIENKKISRIIEKISYIPSITANYWSDLLDSLHNNTLFLKTIDKIYDFYKILIKKKLKKRILEIPEDTDPIIIKDFKQAFLKNPSLTFNQFIINIEKELSEQELKKRKVLIEKAKEKQKLEVLKKTQEEQKKSYEDYFKYSDKEFQRRRRKKKREKLSEIAEKPKKEESLSEDVAEKIKKFKSKFENTFEDKYLIQEDDSKDPINIIRERKKKKEEEYKEFIDKLKK